jgi:signal transduction histidine kinase
MSHLSLKTRMFCIATVAILVVACVAAYRSVIVRKVELMTRQSQYQTTIIQNLINTVSLLMVHEDSLRISAVITKLPSLQPNLHLQILDNRGEIRHSSEKSEIGAKYNEILKITEWDSTGFHQSKFDRDSADFFRIVKRISNLPECKRCHGDSPAIGYLVATIDITWIGSEVSQHAWEDVLTIIGSFAILAWLIAMIHLRFVQRNLKRVLGAIGRVEQGDFNSCIEVESDDEMGRLAESFNRMIFRLKEMQEQLRKVHDEQLARAEKLASVGELAAGMAHEIKNPVSGLLGGFRVILKDVEPGNKRRPFIEEMLRQTERIDQAVNNLLQYARPRSLKKSPSDLLQPIEKALELVSQQARIAKVNVELIPVVDLPPIEIDSEQIEQVVVNLLLNAIQATQPGGEVKVEIEAGSETITVNVIDTGGGIMPAEIELIFKPFHTNKPRGTGLGLAISRRIIEQHGGSLGVARTSSSGSVLQIRLPLRRAVAG